MKLSCHGSLETGQFPDKLINLYELNRNLVHKRHLLVTANQTINIEYVQFLIFYIMFILQIPVLNI